jgi:hypothetical protein
MAMQPINTRALDAALNALVGPEGSELISKLYGVLNDYETSLTEESDEAFNGAFDGGYDMGYDDGTQDGREDGYRLAMQAFTSSEQPMAVVAFEALKQLEVAMDTPQPEYDYSDCGDPNCNLCAYENHLNSLPRAA